VREYSVPSVASSPPATNLSDLIVRNAAVRPHHPALRRRLAGRWREVSAEHFLTEVTALGKGLVAAGVRPGDRVGLMSDTRYEWTVCDFAIWFAGAVSVPVYPTSPAEQVGAVLADSGALACLVDTADRAATVEAARARAPGLERLWCFDRHDLDRLVEEGAEVPDAVLAARRAARGPDDLATIVYTSGTTGAPKGCQLTHGNLLAVLANVCAEAGDMLGERAATVLFLPLAHIFPRVMALACVYSRSQLGHLSHLDRTGGVAALPEELASFGPTFVLGVPRILEKVYTRAHARAHADGRARTFDAAVVTAIAYSRALEGSGPGLRLRTRHSWFERQVYAGLRETLGGNLRYAVSGAAPLSEELGHFLRGAGIAVLEGYGLTETAAGATLNLPHKNKPGTAGRPIPGMAVRIADDDEILVSGPSVFAGYWGDPAATREAVDAEGWLHTGDTGTLDRDGYLRVTGRRREEILTATGRTVAPAVLEERIRAHPLVAQCMLVGEGEAYLAALITVDGEAFARWKLRHGHPAGAPVGELAEDPTLRETVGSAVRHANTTVPAEEGVRRFRILPVAFTEAAGHLTPTRKLRRGAVLKDFAADVQALYD
jgi:long-chain acyl-CoA synthetase